MCLPNFVKFENFSRDEAVTGYRSWRVRIDNQELNLKSETQDYTWPIELVSHEVKEADSGIYSYNYYDNYYNYNYNNKNYNYYNKNYDNYNNNYYNYYDNYNNNYYNYYYVFGIVKQFGKVAIHKTGYRSEFAIVDTLFTIRESNAIGSDSFKNWIRLFNRRIMDIANIYGAKTMHYQDFLESIE